MEAVTQSCCGLDVHQAAITACLVKARPGVRTEKIIREFGTTTGELEKLRKWLEDGECTHVAMESTGVYWIPVYNVLEDCKFELVVGNAQHIKNVPGRKTDVRDAEWLADLVRHGLIRKSFVPSKEFRQLRILTRYRTSLVRAQTAERNRLMKVLETGNIKLSSVASDVFGVSGRLMVKEIIAGEMQPTQMANLAKGVLRKKLDQLAPALNGRIDEHHRQVLAVQYKRIEEIENQLKTIEAQIEEGMKPYQTEIELLRTIPGIDWHVAVIIIAELSIHVSAFSDGKKLVRWAGLAPGDNMSAGKRKSSNITPGNPYLRAALVQAAHAAERTKKTYLREKFYRLKSRRGPKRAAVAVARKLAIYAFNILKTKEPYKELGPDYLDQRSKKQVTSALVKRLVGLGYAVELKEAATP